MKADAPPTWLKQRRLRGFPSGRRVADPVAGPRTGAGDTVLRVGQAALLQRQAAAADALREPVLQALQFRDALLDAARPPAGQLRPIGTLGDAIARQPLQLAGNLVERQPDFLRKHDEGDAAEHGAGKPTMAGAGALRRNQPT